MSWENMTKREIKRIQEKDCKYCKNSIKISSVDSGCDYLAIHKKEDHASPENAEQQEYLNQGGENEQERRKKEKHHENS